MTRVDGRFELRRFRGRGKSGWAGVLGAFGEVVVEARWRKSSVKSGSSQPEVLVSGDGVPAIRFLTVGPGRPTLRNARLTVGGEPVPVAFDRKGLSNTARALTFTCRERAYTYVAESWDRGGTLSRTGVVVSVRRGKSPSGRGNSALGTVEGAADAVDLALAALFVAVDTQELTTAGAVAHVLGRALNPRSPEPVSTG
ncbi:MULTISPECIES: hypothetical protein [Streptomyces]|uniref:Uncharacterized protein n=1 Tax=Streptomyces doudnae TaxID=3075536 RepID=A0ABD5EMH8_9ACTN|nr:MULTISPECIES: hypothetical protein [unclassified Streptomyces]MDT0435893.1 hypothetical protein [Streptomyces sp. DSM 41981]MYQ63940.1 hypothetical protein [Streptomyces sp. SID4950]